MQVSYLPTAPGEYAVHVLVNNDDIPKSPFMADIKPLGAESPAGAPAASPAFDASKVNLNNCLIYKTSPLFFECSSNLKEYEIPWETCILTRGWDTLIVINHKYFTSDILIDIPTDQQFLTIIYFRYW